MADAGQLQQLRGVDRPAAQDELGGPHPLDLAFVAELDADRARALEDDLRDEGAGGHGEVGPAHHRIQVGARGGQPPAPVDVPVEGGEALLPVAVHVVGELIAGLLNGGEERTEQRVGGRAPLEHQRPVVTAERVLLVGGQAVLHPLEVGQAVRVVPLGHACVGRPALVVQRVAALEDHPVDAARPAQDLPAGMVDAPPVQVRLRLAFVLPVVEAAADREGERGGHVDERVPDVVRAARLEHEHPRARVGGQPVRQGAARGSAADDDEVIGAAMALSSHSPPGRSRGAAFYRLSSPVFLHASGPLSRRLLPSSLLRRSSVQAAPRPFGSREAPRPGGTAPFRLAGSAQAWVAASRFSRTVWVIWWSGPR